MSRVNRRNRTLKIEKIISGLICALLVCAAVLAFYYLAEETEHSCTGEECPICVVMQICEKLVRKMGRTEILQSAIAAMTVFAGFVCCLFSLFLKEKTLVEWRVRLNN